VLRVVREILFHEPRGKGTDSVKALEVASHLLHHRAVVFLISDLQSSGDPVQARANLRRAMRQTNRRHDLIAVHIEDPREQALPDVGMLALEDAETGEVVALDTGDPEVREQFHRAAASHLASLMRDIRSEGVDTLALNTNAAHVPALQRFFKSRGPRRS
jgi:uncharacterized protein (DUF58 family)